MKKQILIIALSILSANVYAQDSTKVDCKYSKNEVDEFTGTSKLVLESEMLISHTDSTLLKYYKSKKNQYVECSIYGAKINDLFVLYTNWRIDTKSAYKYFGSIQKEAKLIFKFTDGSTLIINYSNYDIGDTNYDGDYTTYSSYCILKKEQLEELSIKQIEKVRMYWSNGYEDYSVINPTLLNTQMNCLK